jgi:putative ABC transport system permease protein
LAQVRRVLDLVSLALNLVFAFTLAAGGAVLFSVMQTNQESRIRDVAMLKVLGCDRRRIRRALNFEFLTIAIIAGLLGGGAALLTGEWLAEWVFEIPYVTRFKELFFALPTSVIIVWLVSVLGVRKAQSVSPQTVLKDLTI